MSENFKKDRVTVRHLENGKTECINRTDFPFKVKLLDGHEIEVAPWAEFVGTANIQSHTVLRKPVAEVLEDQDAE